MLESWLVQILISFSSLLGVSQYPSEHSLWKIDKSWAKTEFGYSLVATIDYDKINCVQNSELVLPQVIHGVHEVFSGSKLIYRSGDPTFKKMTPFYKRGFVDCNLLSSAEPIHWHVTTYSKYFARIAEFPKVHTSSIKFFFFDVLINLIAAGCLLMLSLLSAYLFYGKIKKRELVALIAGSLGFCLYSAFTVSIYFGINVSMITAHKIADFSLWTGFLAYIYFFKEYKLVSKFEFYAFFTAFIIGQFFICAYSSPDIIQFGTTFQMPFAFMCLIFILISEYFLYKKKKLVLI